MRALLFGVLILTGLAAAATAAEPAKAPETSQETPTQQAQRTGCLLHNLPQPKPPARPSGAPTPATPLRPLEGPLDRLGRTYYCGPNVYEPQKDAAQKAPRST